MSVGVDCSHTTILFDGDDTLWEIQPLYDEAKGRFFDVMEQEEFDRNEVSRMLAEVDQANVRRFGFSRHRFPTSLKTVYQNFCELNGQVPQPKVLARALRLGYSVFRRKPIVKMGARETVMQLSRYFKVCLFTAGDDEIQRKRIVDAGVADLFWAIFVTDRKDASTFRHVLEQLEAEPAKTWMVGNSLKSDINPAVQVGLRCIWVRSSSWEYDADELVAGDVWQVESLEAVRDIVLNSIDCPR